MPLEEEMHNEITRLEDEIALLDEEIQKLYTKVTNLINIRKKKEHNLRVLKENFNLQVDEEEIQLQSSMSKLFGKTAV